VSRSVYAALVCDVFTFDNEIIAVAKRITADIADVFIFDNQLVCAAAVQHGVFIPVNANRRASSIAAVSCKIGLWERCKL
jgi:hypothetical protein